MKIPLQDKGAPLTTQYVPPWLISDTGNWGWICMAFVGYLSVIQRPQNDRIKMVKTGWELYPFNE